MSSIATIENRVSILDGNDFPGENNPVDSWEKKSGI
jgi:hypothetical protein